MTFYDAFAAGALIGISGSAFRKRAERYGVHPQIWPGNRRKFTIEMIREVEKYGKPSMHDGKRMPRLIGSK